MDNELLVKSIRALCKKNSISVSQLENELKFGAGLISRWIKSSPSLDKIIDIADYFNITIDEVIGRTLKSNKATPEEFINTLYTLTVDRKLIWEDHTNQLPNLEDNNFFCLEDDGYDNKELFVTSYQSGFFLLYCQYDEEKGSVTDFDIQIYIRPDQKSKAVLQDSNDKKAYQLWLLIHTSMYGTLDEVKAEELKNNFISNSASINKTNKKSGEPNLLDIERVLSDPSILKLLETYNTPEFQQLQKTFSNPEFQAAIQVANKMQKYFDRMNK